VDCRIGKSGIFGSVPEVWHGSGGLLGKGGIGESLCLNTIEVRALLDKFCGYFTVGKTRAPFPRWFNSGEHMSRNHPLFKRFPLNGSIEISIGKVQVPYHIYDGHGLLIGGTADFKSVQEFVHAEAVNPIQAQDRTFMAIWICNFTDANLGPHHELQFSFFVSQANITPSHRLGVLELMSRPETQMLCHGLWNDTAKVVAYNRELLSLNARQAISRIKDSPETFAFQFHDATASEHVLSGKVSNPRKFCPGAGLELIMSLGFRRVWSMARQPWSNLQILNPVGVGLTHNAITETYTKNTRNRLNYFHSSVDTLEFGPTPYARLDFKPQFAHYMSGFNFVYLPPKSVPNFKTLMRSTVQPAAPPVLPRT
jgi:hypothetical protein